MANKDIEIQNLKNIIENQKYEMNNLLRIIDNKNFEIKENKFEYEERLETANQDAVEKFKNKCMELFNG